MSSSRVLTVLTQIMVMAVVIAIILLFIGIGVLILIHLCIVGRAFRRSFRSNIGGVSSVSATSSAVRVGGVVSGNSNGGMSEKDVQKLPSYKHEEREFFAMEEYDKNNSSGNKFDRTECAVCLDGYERGDTCRLLPVCRHSFHAKCVDAWLYKNPMCPICRTSAEQEDCGEGGKEGLELGGGGVCEARRVGVELALGMGEEGRSGFYQVSETINSTLPRSVPSSPAGDEIRYVNI
ncbi:hypothetical protein SUGI_0564430 [Cryptomeria japonica]|nr:hypothetical protein SUGI_0564430 [Cryptomeria japonica]